MSEEKKQEDFEISKEEIIEAACDKNLSMKEGFINKPMNKSKCCGAEVMTSQKILKHNNGSTSFGKTKHYVCNKCHKPCDLAEEPMKKESWEEMLEKFESKLPTVITNKDWKKLKQFISNLVEEVREEERAKAKAGMRALLSGKENI